MIGRDDTDPLFLQIKEADASVLEAHVGTSAYASHGRRVVEGQRLLQASSDILLGWTHATGLDGLESDYYTRQLWDWKVSEPVVYGLRSRDLAVFGMSRDTRPASLATSHEWS